MRPVGNPFACALIAVGDTAEYIGPNRIGWLAHTDKPRLAPGLRQKRPYQPWRILLDRFDYLAVIVLDIKLLRDHHPLEYRILPDSAARPDDLKAELSWRIDKIKRSDKSRTVKIKRIRNARHLVIDKNAIYRLVLEIAPDEIPRLEKLRHIRVLAARLEIFHKAVSPAAVCIDALAVRLIATGILADHLQRENIAVLVCIDDLRHSQGQKVM